jgi:hypothetical protein
MRLASMRVVPQVDQAPIAAAASPRLPAQAAFGDAQRIPQYLQQQVQQNEHVASLAMDVFTAQLYHLQRLQRLV